MQKTLVYPKNKGQFLRLMQFGKEIISICKDLGSTPVLYGSFAHFLYTNDKGMNVNDLDLLVPKRKLAAISCALKRKGIKYASYPKWDGLVIKKGNLRVEMDSMESTYKDTVWHRKLPKDFVDLNIDDMKIKMISLKGMKRLYEIAYARSKDDKVKLRKQIKRLEAALNN